MNRRELLIVSGTAGIGSLTGCLSLFNEEGVIVDLLEAVNYGSEERAFSVAVKENGELYSEATAQISPRTELETPSEIVDITLPEQPGDYSVECIVDGEAKWIKDRRILDQVDAGRCVRITCEFDPLGEVERIDEVGIHIRDFGCPDRFE